MKLTRREQTILTVCSGVMLALLARPMAVSNHVGAENSAASDANQHGPAGSALTRTRIPRWIPAERSPDYSVIGERGLLGATLVESRSARVTPPNAPLANVALPTTADLLPPEDPEHEMLSFVGLVCIDGDRQAVLESLPQDETVFVRVGERAFGYRVESMSVDAVVLRKDGKEYRLTLGENKPDRFFHRPPRPAEGERSPTLRESAVELRLRIEDERSMEEHTRRHEIREQENREREELERQQMESQGTS